jgi:WD40 repeat protein
MLALLPLILLPCLPGDPPPTLASKPLLEEDAQVVRLAASEKGATLLLATAKGHVAAWNVAKVTQLWRNEPGGWTDHREARSEQDPPFVRALEVGDKFAFLCRTLPIVSVHSLDVATGKETSNYMSIPDIGVGVVAIRCDPRDRWAWLACESGRLARHIPNGGSRAYNFRSVPNKPRSLAYDADASLVAVGGADGTVRFANASSATVDDEKVLKGPDSALTALDFAAKGTLLLGGSENGEMTIWTVATGKPRPALKVGDAAVKHLLVHPKGKWFVTGDAAGSVKVWSVDKGELLATLACDGAIGVRALAFVDGGKQLAGAMGGKTVVTWDVAKL